MIYSNFPVERSDFLFLYFCLWKVPYLSFPTDNGVFLPFSLFSSPAAVWQEWRDGKKPSHHSVLFSQSHLRCTIQEFTQAYTLLKLTDFLHQTILWSFVPLPPPLRLSLPCMIFALTARPVLITLSLLTASLPPRFFLVPSTILTHSSVSPISRFNLQASRKRFFCLSCAQTRICSPQKYISCQISNRCWDFESLKA